MRLMASNATICIPVSWQVLLNLAVPYAWPRSVMMRVEAGLALKMLVRSVMVSVSVGGWGVGRSVGDYARVYSPAVPVRRKVAAVSASCRDAGEPSLLTSR